MACALLVGLVMFLPGLGWVDCFGLCLFWLFLSYVCVYFKLWLEFPWWGVNCCTVLRCVFAY